MCCTIVLSFVASVGCEDGVVAGTRVVVVFLVELIAGEVGFVRTIVNQGLGVVLTVGGCVSVALLRTVVVLFAVPTVGECVSATEFLASAGILVVLLTVSVTELWIGLLLVVLTVGGVFVTADLCAANVFAVTEIFVEVCAVTSLRVSVEVVAVVLTVAIFIASGVAGVSVFSAKLA